MTDKEITQAREIVSRIPEQEKTEMLLKILIENEAIPELLKEAKKLARKK